MASAAPRAEWNEEDHPRDNDGKFGSGGGSDASGGSAGGDADSEPDSAEDDDPDEAPEAHEIAAKRSGAEAAKVHDDYVTREAERQASTLKEQWKSADKSARDASRALDKELADAGLTSEDEHRLYDVLNAQERLRVARLNGNAEKIAQREHEVAAAHEDVASLLERLGPGFLERLDGATNLNDSAEEIRGEYEKQRDWAKGKPKRDKLIERYQKSLDSGKHSQAQLAREKLEELIDDDTYPTGDSSEFWHRFDGPIDRDGDGKTNEVERGTTEADQKQKGLIQLAQTDRQIWKVESRATAKALELDIYDDIGGISLLGGGITAASVRAALRGQNPKETLVRIHSAGGIVLEGLAIYNMFKQMTGKVICRVDSLAGSIASIIAMGGDELEMAEQSFLMIHNPFGMVEGGSDELRSQANLLDTMREQMLDIYCAKCGRSREEVGRLMDEETWMTAKDALAFGFADRVIPESQNKLVAHMDLSRFRRAPKAAAEPKTVAPEMQIPAEATATEPEETPMSMTAEEAQKMADLEAAVATLTASLDTEKGARASAEEALAKSKTKAAIPDDDDDEDDEEEMAKASALAEAMELTGCKDVKKLRGALMGYADSLKAKQSSQTVAQRVSELIKAGKVRPDMKAKALKMSHAEIDGYLEMTGGAKLGPVAEEHTPDDEHPNVVQARANATAPSAKFDPESIQLDAADLHYCKARDPLGTEKLAEKYLAQKRADAQSAWERTHGRSAA